MATKDVCAKVFQPLDAGRCRLVEICPGTWDQPIVCKLASNVDISLCRYEALSYCCGDPSASPHLISVNAYDYSVLPSLFTALRRLRHPEASRVMWIDALCINPADVAEKSIQIQMMGKIYLHAGELVVWLGEEEEDSSLAMKTIRSVSATFAKSDVENFSEGDGANFKAFVGPTQKIDIRPWIALSNLATRPYFERLWVSGPFSHCSLKSTDVLAFRMFRSFRRSVCRTRSLY
jgi:hypothetical protein